jgi:NDP-sugar pyrophosphorylase family protein
MLPCLVLGGGAGTRMRPATLSLPKPLLPVAGEPFVVHQLRWLAAQGVSDVVYSIGYLGAMIRDELERRDLGTTVRFVDEGENLLGTGGAIRLAVEQGAVHGPFFVLYGDSYLDLDLARVADTFRNRDCEALMTVYRNDGQFDRSNAFFDGSRVVRYDKVDDPAAAGMRYIDYGLLVLTSRLARDRVPRTGRCDLADVLRDVSASGRLAGFEAGERFYEIGSPAGLAALERHLQRDDVAVRSDRNG